jgi:hypothetical protein
MNQIPEEAVGQPGWEELRDDNRHLKSVIRDLEGETFDLRKQVRVQRRQLEQNAWAEKAFREVIRELQAPTHLDETTVSSTIESGSNVGRDEVSDFRVEPPGRGFQWFIRRLQATESTLRHTTYQWGREAELVRHQRGVIRRLEEQQAAEALDEGEI